MFDQTSLKKDTVKRGNPSYRYRQRKTLCSRLSKETPCMPIKKKNPDKGKKLLEETKKRIRLEQEARTRERLEQLEQQDFESFLCTFRRET